MSRREVPARVLGVAASVALVCSVLVTSAVTWLRPLQRNHEMAVYNRNLLQAAGITIAEPHNAHALADAVAGLELRYIDLARGEVVAAPVDADADAFAFAQTTTNAADEGEARKGVQGLRRPAVMPAYLTRDATADVRLVLPAYGQGMWSTIAVFIGVADDYQHIARLVVHEHGETPGIGDRIEDPAWLAHWRGRQFANWQLAETAMLELRRGPAAAAGDSGIDVISGATVTCNKVVDLANDWLGDDGFGPWLHRLADVSGATR